MEDLKNIIKEIQGYKEELGLKKLSDDMILDTSVRIFNSQNIPRSQYPSEKTYSQNQNKEFKLKNPHAAATEKQIYALKKMGVPNPEKLTKLEASQVIKEKKEELPDY